MLFTSHIREAHCFAISKQKEKKNNIETQILSKRRASVFSKQTNKRMKKKNTFQRFFFLF